jgi:hypothetical protein
LAVPTSKPENIKGRNRIRRIHLFWERIFFPTESSRKNGSAIGGKDCFEKIRADHLGKAICRTAHILSAGESTIQPSPTLSEEYEYLFMAKFTSFLRKSSNLLASISVNS